MKKVLGGMFALLLTFLLAVPIIQAATITVSQAGADPDTVMKGKPFTITVSGLSGSGTVSLINLPAGFSAEGSPPYPKSFAGGTPSVSWTSATISQSHDSITITAQIAGAGSPSTAESRSFGVILLPSISLSVSPSSVTAGSVYSVSLNIQNSGETSAKSVSIAVSGTGMSVSSGCSSISLISAGSSSSASCAILASTPGTHSVQLTVTPSNADPRTETISVTVTGHVIGNGDGPPGGGGPLPAKNASRRPELVPGIGLRNNTKLLAAIEKVLAKGKLSDQAIENLMRLSASITADIEVGREFNASGGKSTLTLTMKYNGERQVNGFIVHDVLPKAFAQHTGNITVSALGASIEIVEEDPEYMFLYPRLLSGQEITIIYNIDREVSTSVINDTETWIYAESYEEIPAPEGCNPGELKCVGNALQKCNPEGTAWFVLETCEHGCENNACISEPTEEEKPIDYTLILWIVSIVIAVVVVAGLLYYFAYYKKKTSGFNFKPLSV